MTALLRFSGAMDVDPAIERWLARHPDELGGLASDWFDVIRSAGPGVLELLHDGYPTVCVEEAPFAYVGLFKSHVNLGFFHGASLPDAGGWLEGSGKSMRHVKLRLGVPVDEAALKALVAAAYDDVVARLSGFR